jgi:hypothetical protein
MTKLRRARLLAAQECYDLDEPYEAPELLWAWQEAGMSLNEAHVIAASLTLDGEASS